jgi:DNA-binding GntR family transcriptional regulator
MAMENSAILSNETHLLAAHSAPRVTAPEWLYQELRRRIIQGEFQPGQALRQQHLATEFGLSAIPVREALRMLEADRFVVIHANRGAVVRTVSLADAEEIVHIRLAVEPLAIVMAVPHMTPQDLDVSRSLLDSYAGNEDPFESSALNRRFHFSLYQACGSPRLLKIIDSLFDEVLRFAHVNISDQLGNEFAQHEHMSIWLACSNNDPELAAERLHAHIERSRKSLVKLLAEQR